MRQKKELKATPYKSYWKDGLSPRALRLLGGDVKVERVNAFLVGRHNELCALDKYILPDGRVYYDAVQVELYEPTGPQYLFALKDENGEWVEESRWTKEEIQEVVKNLDATMVRSFQQKPGCVRVVAEDPEILPIY